MEVEDQNHFLVFPKPSNWLGKLLSFQVDFIYNSLVSIFSPIYSLFTLTFESYHHTEESKENVQSEVEQAPYSSKVLLKKLGLGFLSAAYVCMVLVLVLVVASVVGVCLVRLWVEEPVFVKENVYFDYTDANPTAMFLFDGGVSGHIKKKQISVPVGHTFDVSLSLVMPESDFNRDLGVFQLNAELLSVNGNVIMKSSQPCMLRFRSSPVRLARTVLMGVPLVLGISGETQKINVEIVRHKEDHRRTNAIRVTLHPRAGTSSLPQIYEAEIVMNTQLPWSKELVRHWKWTFYVWVPLIFLVTPEYFSPDRVSEVTSGEHRELQVREGDESEVSELLNKWRSQRKRKAITAHGGGNDRVGETIGSSASSVSKTTREDVTSVAVEDDVEDSESVCLG
ncbi:putative Seipin family protein [Lupinus albus]|uniref:Putative Seipin family protein n=1 Tax=Lupinus albus TaxID=3870 RepID=A0A6A4QSI6_LUPAL|nr:putative Seipin family protein [Lupinus albus]